MKVVTLRIDSQMFYLRRDEDVDALKAQVLTAARGAAQFVEFDPAGRGHVSVLMTPATPVRFEEQEHDDTDSEDWNEHPPHTEFDFYNVR